MHTPFLMRYFAPQLARQAADSVARETGEKNLPLRRAPTLDAVNRYLPWEVSRHRSTGLLDRVERTAPHVTLDTLVGGSSVTMKIPRYVDDALNSVDRSGYDPSSSTSLPQYFSMDATPTTYGVPSSAVSVTFPSDAAVYGTPSGAIASYGQIDTSHYR